MDGLILIPLYIFPLLRLLLFFVPSVDSNAVRKIDIFAGKIEWVIHPVRDYIFIFALPFLVWKISYTFAPFIAVSIFAIIRYKLHMRKMCEFARTYKFANPKDFFDFYYAGFGFFPIKFPSSVALIDPTNCSYKIGKNSAIKLAPTVYGAFNTFTLTHLVMAGLKWKGPVFAREVADSLATIWGARVLELGQLSLKVIGLEKIEGLEGKCILAFTHKSFLDFALGTFALSQRFSFRFLAAKDHFLDNIFLYLLFGRAMKAIGTIFVDRKKGKTDPKKSAHDAVERLVDSEAAIAIFPQGTRAYATLNNENHRVDSGYYTSGTKERLKKHGGHIKKGTAFIAVDAAMEMKNLEKGIVNVIPIGLIGTGLAAPKGKIKIKTGTDIIVKIADPIIIKKEDINDIKKDDINYITFVEKIHKTLDERFKNILDLHISLEQRFYTDIRKIIPYGDFEHLSIAMKSWRTKDSLIFEILDCIYSCKPNNWHAFLRELCYLIVDDAPIGTMNHFKERVVEKMIEGK